MGKKTRQKSKKESKNFWSCSSLMALGLFAGAMFQNNVLIHQNSLSRDLEKNIAALVAENDDYEMKLSQSNSLANFSLYAEAQAGKYEKVDVATVRYVHAVPEQFARK